MLGFGGDVARDPFRSPRAPVTPRARTYTAPDGTGYALRAAPATAADFLEAQRRAVGKAELVALYLVSGFVSINGETWPAHEWERAEVGLYLAAVGLFSPGAQIPACHE